MERKMVELWGKQFYVGDILVVGENLCRVTETGSEVIPRPTFKARCMSDGTVYEILPSGTYRKLKGEEARVWHAYNKIDRQAFQKLLQVGL